MIHITTQHRLHLWVEPIDFRKGLDSLVGICRQNIGSPYDGTVFAFRNKSGIAVKLLVYDGHGFFGGAPSRFSQGQAELLAQILRCSYICATTMTIILNQG